MKLIRFPKSSLSMNTLQSPLRKALPSYGIPLVFLSLLFLAPTVPNISDTYIESSYEGSALGNSQDPLIESLDADNPISYVILASEEIKIEGNTVSSGGIGVWGGNGAAFIEKDNDIRSFIRSPEINLKNEIDYQDVPKIFSEAPQPASEVPLYINNNGQDVDIKKNQTSAVELPLSEYGKIVVETNNTVVFRGQDTVYIEELIVKDADNGDEINIDFGNRTVLVIQKKLEIGKSVSFNSGGTLGVSIYMIDGDLIVQAEASVTAMIDARNGKIDVKGKENGAVTLMNGQFMAQEIVAGKNVEWRANVEGLIETIGPPEVVLKDDLGEVNLAHLAGLAEAEAQGNTADIMSNDAFQIDDQGRVFITVIARPGKLDEAQALLLSLGMVDLIYSIDYPLTIAGFLPCPNAIDLDANSDILLSADVIPRPIVDGGLVTSQGDRAQRSDLVREGYALDGAGVKIGVISDSYAATSVYTTATQDIANGDLPATGVEVLSDGSRFSDPTDEGRAMLQIVHDVAPGAELAFKTGFVTAGDFAKSIKDLANVNCDIIVDDVTWITEPFFTDGAVALAVDTVTAAGVTYVSAAGNYGPRAYGASFNSGGPVSTVGSAELSAIYANNPNATIHNFGSSVQQRLRLEPGNYTFALHWDEPVVSLDGENGGAMSDLDFYVVNDDGSLRFKINGNEITKDPNTFGHIQVGGSADVETNIVIVNASGSNPVNFKYIFFSRCWCYF